MLKTIKLPNKSALGKNNGSKLAFNGNNNNKIAMMRLIDLVLIEIVWKKLKNQENQ